MRRPLYRRLPASLGMPDEKPVAQKPLVAVTCPRCNGMREYPVEHLNMPETRHMVQCDRCNGVGEIIE